MSPDTITIASQWTDSKRGKIISVERVELPGYDYTEKRIYENGEEEYLVRYTVSYPEKPEIKETQKEKLLRKKKEKMNSLPEKVKRRIGRWRF